MSVVINSNSAAALAANNLAASNSMLQKSLNRLSSGSKIVNPADDAGGLAVSMKLSAAAKRQGAVNTNVGNTVSFLQTQDGVLATAGKVLNRISELKVLHGDPTKSTSDKANYQTEFAALQAQLTSLGSEKFNGVSLFGSSNLTVGTTEDGLSSVTADAIDLLGAGSGGFATFSDNFADLSNWTNGSFAGGSATTSSNTLDLFGSSGLAQITSNTSFSGPFEINLTLQFPSNTTDNLQVRLGSDTLVNINYSDFGDNAAHSVRIAFDGAGNASTYFDGSGTASKTQSGISATSGTIQLSEVGLDHTLVSNFSIASTAGGGGNTSSVANAADLGSLDLSTITSSIQDIATYRAQNGAAQSRLGFASELLTVNKANLEAANSRIVDVDVAEESTQLARFNTLVQAGTAMLSQANQSTQIALKLLG